ncbi:MAG: EscU/YscU/HrcU family type III secretion system export apparatus switch protein [Buchnera aphidicola (Meitanaphis microgallis)]
MSGDNNEEKTEKPTSYKLKKAKKKGNKRYSRELHSLLILISTLMVFWFNKKDIIILLETIIRSGLVFDNYIIRNEYIFNSNFFLLEKSNIFCLFKIIFFPMFLVALLSIIFSNLDFHIKFLTFRFDTLNPVKGLKKLFSGQIIIELFKTILKVLFVSCILYFYVSYFFLRSLSFIDKNIFSALQYSFFSIFLCILIILITIIPIVSFDIFLERYNYYKRLRMTRQEVKDELKKTEGNPYIKSRIRNTMKTITRRRMLCHVSKSDVIIMNPVHYAIALQYDEKNMNAPKILAKGSGKLALKIRKIGEKYSVPIFFSSSLACALYRCSEIGQYIPNTLYIAIAEVLAWVCKVQNWKEKGGIFPKQPNNFFIPLKSHTLEEDKN